MKVALRRSSLKCLRDSKVDRWLNIDSSYSTGCPMLFTKLSLKGPLGRAERLPPPCRKLELRFKVRLLRLVNGGKSGRSLDRGSQQNQKDDVSISTYGP